MKKNLVKIFGLVFLAALLVGVTVFMQAGAVEAAISDTTGAVLSDNDKLSEDNWSLLAPPPWLYVNFLDDQLNLTSDKGIYNSLVFTRIIEYSADTDHVGYISGELYDPDGILVISVSDVEVNFSDTYGIFVPGELSVSFSVADIITTGKDGVYTLWFDFDAPNSMCEFDSDPFIGPVMTDYLYINALIPSSNLSISVNQAAGVNGGYKLQLLANASTDVGRIIVANIAMSYDNQVILPVDQDNGEEIELDSDLPDNTRKAPFYSAIKSMMAPRVEISGTRTAFDIILYDPSVGGVDCENGKVLLEFYFTLMAGKTFDDMDSGTFSFVTKPTPEDFAVMLGSKQGTVYYYGTPNNSDTITLTSFTYTNSDISRAGAKETVGTETKTLWGTYTFFGPDETMMIKDSDSDLGRISISPTRNNFVAAGEVLYQTSSRQAVVSLYDNANQLVGSATTATNGAYSLNVTEGTGYTLMVYKPGYLSYTIKNLTLINGQPIETIDIRQMAGDINGDGIVNAVDLTYLLSEFNRAPVIHQYADIDGNGIVNATDLTYLLAGFNKRNVVVVAPILSNKTTIYAVEDNLYDITISAAGVANFNAMEVKMTYNSAIFDIVDVCAFTKTKETTTGAIYAAGITITQISPGQVKFTVNKAIPSGSQWAGALTTVRLKAKATAVSTVSVE